MILLYIFAPGQSAREQGGAALAPTAGWRVCTGVERSPSTARHSPPRHATIDPALMLHALDTQEHAAKKAKTMDIMLKVKL